MFEHPGLIAVFIGVTGEVCIDWKEEIGPHSRWKKIFMALLVLGLAYELYEAVEADKKTAAAIKLAGEANERASTNELQVVVLKNETALLVSSNLNLAANVEELKSNNIILAAKLLPRTIDDEQANQLEHLLFPIPKAMALDEPRFKIVADLRVIDSDGYALGIWQALNNGRFDCVKDAFYGQLEDNTVFPPGITLVDRRQNTFFTNWTEGWPINGGWMTHAEPFPNEKQDNMIIEAFQKCGVKITNQGTNFLWLTDIVFKNEGKELSPPCLYILVGPKEIKSTAKGNPPKPPTVPAAGGFPAGNFMNEGFKRYAVPR